MTNENNNHQKDDPRDALIADLKRQLEAKNEDIFDLSATLSSVQLEAQQQRMNGTAAQQQQQQPMVPPSEAQLLEQQQKEAAETIRKLQEDLRRTQQEANISNSRAAQLQRKLLQQQEQQHDHHRPPFGTTATATQRGQQSATTTSTTTPKGRPQQPQPHPTSTPQSVTHDNHQSEYNMAFVHSNDEDYNNSNPRHYHHQQQPLSTTLPPPHQLSLSSSSSGHQIRLAQHLLQVAAPAIIISCHHHDDDDDKEETMTAAAQRQEQEQQERILLHLSQLAASSHPAESSRRGGNDDDDVDVPEHALVMFLLQQCCCHSNPQPRRIGQKNNKGNGTDANNSNNDNIIMVATSLSSSYAWLYHALVASEESACRRWLLEACCSSSHPRMENVDHQGLPSSSTHPANTSEATFALRRKKRKRKKSRIRFAAADGAENTPLMECDNDSNNSLTITSVLSWQQKSMQQCEARLRSRGGRRNATTGLPSSLSSLHPKKSAVQEEESRRDDNYYYFCPLTPTLHQRQSCQSFLQITCRHCLLLGGASLSCSDASSGSSGATGRPTKLSNSLLTASTRALQVVLLLLQQRTTPDGSSNDDPWRLYQPWMEGLLIPARGNDGAPLSLVDLWCDAAHVVVMRRRAAAQPEIKPTVQRRQGRRQPALEKDDDDDTATDDASNKWEFCNEEYIHVWMAAALQVCHALYEKAASLGGRVTSSSKSDAPSTHLGWWWEDEASAEAVANGNKNKLGRVRDLLAALLDWMETTLVPTPELYFHPVARAAVTWLYGLVLFPGPPSAYHGLAGEGEFLLLLRVQMATAMTESMGTVTTSALGVMVKLFHGIVILQHRTDHLPRDDEDASNESDLNSLRDNLVRLLDLILRQTQLQRRRVEQIAQKQQRAKGNGKSDGQDNASNVTNASSARSTKLVSFWTLLSEYQELYRSAAGLLLTSATTDAEGSPNKRCHIHANIKSMLRMQLEELDMDEEDRHA